jgi:hypothetical protein
MKSAALLAGLLAAAMVWGAAHAQAKRSRATSEMALRAQAFLDTLDSAQNKRARFPLDAPAWKDWHFVPRDRPGIALGELSKAQADAARALLRSALSSQGIDKVDGVITLESVLHEIESRPGAPADGRDPAKYELSIFGDPSGKDPWGWRIEGHHLSLTFTSVTAELVCTTPYFFGASPEKVQGGAHHGLRVLGAEEDLARALFEGLDPEQRALALLPGKTPTDIIYMPGRDSADAPAGIAAARLRDEQRAALMRLIDRFVGDLEPQLAEHERARMRDAGIEKIHFAWAGEPGPESAWYYRIQGPHFVIELDHPRGDPTHVHAVWRDLERDFGGDPLRRHLAR